MLIIKEFQTLAEAKEKVKRTCKHAPRDATQDPKVKRKFIRWTIERMIDLLLYTSHPDFYAVLLHPVLRNSDGSHVRCIDAEIIASAVRAAQEAQPSIILPHLKFQFGSSHVCTACPAYASKPVRFQDVVLTPIGRLNTVVQEPSCRRETVSANAKKIRPKGIATTHRKEKVNEGLFCELVDSELFEFIKVQQHRVFDLIVQARPPQQQALVGRGLALQLASAVRRPGDVGSNFAKTKFEVADVLIMGAMFVALDISQDGTTIKRVLMIPPNDLTALMHVFNLSIEHLYFTGATFVELADYIYNASLPQDVLRMRGVLQEALADNNNLFLTKAEADTLISSQFTFLEHVGIETILLGRTAADAVEYVDSVQGDILFIRNFIHQLVEFKTTHEHSKQDECSIKCMENVDILAALVIDDTTRNDVYTLHAELVSAMDHLKESGDTVHFRAVMKELMFKFRILCSIQCIDGIYIIRDPFVSVTQPKVDAEVQKINLNLSVKNGKVVGWHLLKPENATYVDTSNMTHTELFNAIQ